jgi:hypothetical protein
MVAVTCTASVIPPAKSVAPAPRTVSLRISPLAEGGGTNTPFLSKGFKLAPDEI